MKYIFQVVFSPIEWALLLCIAALCGIGWMLGKYADFVNKKLKAIKKRVNELSGEV